MTTRKITQLQPLTTALTGAEQYEAARDNVSYALSGINLFKTVGVLPATDGAPSPSSGYRIALYKISDGSPYSCTLDEALSLLLGVASYSVATAPDAVAAGAGAMIYVTNGNAGSPCVGVSNGTNWKVVALGATISAS